MNDIGTNSSDGAKSDGGFGSINSNSNKFEVESIPIPEKNGIITSLATISQKSLQATLQSRFNTDEQAEGGKDSKDRGLFCPVVEVLQMLVRVGALMVR